VCLLGGILDPDLPQRDARDRLGLPSDVPIALFFGSLRPAKGLDVLLGAWPEVVRQIPQALLVVAGKPSRGPGAESLTSQVLSLGTWSGVRAELRQIDPAEANSFYRASDVVVLPYLEIGTSGVLRYAHSSARAVVASAVGEHNTWVIPGRTGCLVPPGDTRALASALVKVLVDRPGAAAMGERALELSNSQFAWSDISLATIRLYEQILDRGLVVGGA
jgi:glycosyltransferase involved in cell wall biosynthesis